ncbi:hypothetical protein TUMEXPCC7403_16980 [Tumidithrix helvetica PCC 7403]|uniref:hypothetical protein n=1 Tax=Tumidithrix helvetica TaxID=3457545 RepID=UPI003C9DBFC9
MERFIMLPSDAGFYDILHKRLPPSLGENNCYIPRADSNILEAVNLQTAIEYAMGGEMDECRFGNVEDGMESNYTDNVIGSDDYDCDDNDGFEQSLDWLQSHKQSDWKELAKSW